MYSHDSVLEFEDLSSKKKKIIVGSLVGILVVVIIIIAVVVSSQQHGAPPPATTSLPSSTSGQLLTLTQQTPLGPITVARSYDGQNWEIISNSNAPPITIACDTTGCTVTTPGFFTVQSVTVPPELASTTPSQQLARLFSQATFGVNKAYMSSALAAYQTNFQQWILDQMALPATQHRVYYRQRTNSRVYSATAIPTANYYQPCDIGSRWHSYAFDKTDMGKTLLVSFSSNQYTLRVDGLTVGVVSTFPYNASYPVALYICSVVEQTGGKVGFGPDSFTCKYSFPNPTISFSSVDASTTVSLTTNQAQFSNLQDINKTDVVILTQMSATCSPNIAFLGYNGNYYRFDQRRRLQKNTPEAPATTPIYPAVGCPAAPVSPLSQSYCQRLDSCAPATYSQALVTLNDATMRTWYTKNEIFVYYMLELRLETPYAVSPCSGVSRWLRLGPGACPNPAALDSVTLNTFVTALSTSTDVNPYVRDIKLTGGNCTASANTIGMQVYAASECFQNVHPDLYSVRDASRWVTFHQGNQKNFNANIFLPVAIPAQTGYTNLTYPSFHVMGLWKQYVGFLPVIGRYGDVMNFTALPKYLQTPALAEQVGSVASSTTGFQICGSPGEVENDPTYGNLYQFPDQFIGPFLRNDLEFPSYYDPNEGKSIVWENVVLKAADQLRQRVAWTLSEVFIVSAVSISLANQVEPWTEYYDIFVRNAFGNYYDILKEVSYSPMMGMYLTYIQNKGLGVSGYYPDENYAREIMQLFSIGLFELNNDYTQVADANGNPIATYTNEDIMDYARIWTGFDYQLMRGNLEQVAGFTSNANNLDPMQIQPTWRDVLPKSKLLNSGYLGDAYPLCDSLPPRHWLTVGATWVYSGSTSIEGSVLDSGAPNAGGYRGRFTLSPSSALYQSLCQPDGTGTCTFPKSVVLSQNLPCDGEECDAGRVITAQVVDANTKATRYYTYLSVPCVRLTFYDKGQVTAYSGNRQCTNPISPVAYPVCCKPPNSQQVTTNPSVCLFANEAVNFNTAISRCAASNYTLCTSNRVIATWNSTCSQSVYMWTNVTCSHQVQVFPSGRVAVYDPLASFSVLKLNTSNIFRVMWDGHKYPQAPNCGLNCTVVPNTQGPTCLCPLSVVEGVVYTDPTTLPSQAEVLAALHIGAPTPSSFGSGAYVQCTTGPCAGRTDVKVWNLAGNSAWDETTIFEIPPLYLGGTTTYLSNKNSTVYVNDYSFRNPPRFMQFTGEMSTSSLSLTNQLRQAQLEVEALLQHLFTHKNTAPFVSYRLIQHMVTSNPSARYVDAVATAFRTGTYNGHTYSGVYGDLGAAVAAVLLDREARSPMLEVDPTFGMFREPMIKLMHFMRSMEYTSRDGREMVLTYLYNTIGMEVFNSQTVFSFFTPDNQVSGILSRMGLVAPEGQLAIPPFIVGWMNGLASLVNYGLTSCYYGFGYGTSNCNVPDGTLKYTPSNGMTPSDIIEELNLLLTSGRLNSATKKFLLDKYNTEANTSSPAAALRLIQKYLASTPEFHTTTANVQTNQSRTPSEQVASQGRPYKALVIVILSGGCDSYNMLIPHSDCGTTGLDATYQSVRGLAAVQGLPIGVPAGSQACNTFAVHPAMPTVKDLYDAKDLSWYSNIGALVQPTTKANYLGIQKAPLPPSLFGHYQMSRSAQNMDPIHILAKGVLGRAVSALEGQSNPYATDVFDLAGQITMVNGVPDPYFINPYSGVIPFKDTKQPKQMSDGFYNFTGYTSSVPFTDSFSGILNQSIGLTAQLAQQIGNTTLATTFKKDSLSVQLQMVSKLIKLRNMFKSERGIFVTTIGGFDTHATVDLAPIFTPINDGLASFQAEMVAQGVWDNVAFVTMSEFGRTLTTNGAGTDHGWGGNHFIAGGSVKGGNIFGKYPDVLTDDGPLSVGRGRFIPTMGWEGMWQGVFQWLGVDPSLMDLVLPNMGNFPADTLFDQSEVFN